VRLLIAGGGTGGHLFPASPSPRKSSGAEGGKCSSWAPAAASKPGPCRRPANALETLVVSGLKRMGLLATLRGLLRLPLAILRSFAILRRFRPDVVVGVGGYASGPLVLAAVLASYPTAIQEQNSVPGITNRVLGKLVAAVFIAFEDAKRFFPSRKIQQLGNPCAPRSWRRSKGAAAASPSAEKLRILVVGG